MANAFSRMSAPWGRAQENEDLRMPTQILNLLRHLLPSRFIQNVRLQNQNMEPWLVDDFSLPLRYPMTSAPQRFASTERLLHARRRGSVSE